jgi:hypothetical protein
LPGRYDDFGAGLLTDRRAVVSVNREGIRLELPDADHPVDADVTSNGVEVRGSRDDRTSTVASGVNRSCAKDPSSVLDVETRSWIRMIAFLSMANTDLHIYCPTRMGACGKRGELRDTTPGPRLATVARVYWEVQC